MADLNKNYLDQQGLALYDKLIKEYIDKANNNDAENMQKIIDDLAALAETVEANSDAIAANKEAIEDNAAAIEILNGDKDVEGSVAQKIDDAITSLIDGAPEALDTLKEIADWIADDETGTAALIDRVAQNEEDIAANKEAIEALQAKQEEESENLKDYIDTQDKYYWDHIGSIEDLRIQALFAQEQAEDESAADAIAALEAGAALKLNADQTIADDIVIDKDCYIDANGATFEGTVTVPAGANVVIENATFANPVIVA